MDASTAFAGLDGAALGAFDTVAFPFVAARAARVDGAARRAAVGAVLRGAVRTAVVVGAGCGDGAAVERPRAVDDDCVDATTGASGVGTSAAVRVGVIFGPVERGCAVVVPATVAPAGGSSGTGTGEPPAAAA